MRRRIAIVGAGPAGSATALGLLERGVDPEDLVVLDKARFPRPKLCGGALTWRGTAALGALIGELPGGLRTSSLLFRSALGELAIVERGPQWVYDRAVLDAALLGAVKERGVEVREEAPVSGLEPARDGWTVRTGRVAETYRWVVGADGACGISRRAAKLPGGRIGRLVEAVYAPRSGAPDATALLFDFDPILEGIPGYAWVFPYPSGDGPSGLYKLGVMDGRGTVPGSTLRAWLARFAARRGFQLVDEKLAGWPERLYTHGARGHLPGLVLVGEAFAIDPLLGEGIAPALAHARYAAERLREALDAGRSVIPAYERRFIRTEEGRNLRFQTYLSDLLYGPNGPRWLRVLFELPRLRALGASGREAYGRLARHAPSLVAAYGWHVLTRGLPSSAAPDRLALTSDPALISGPAPAGTDRTAAPERSGQAACLPSSPPPLSPGAHPRPAPVSSSEPPTCFTAS
jgi:flavin-dependent dehydrogenase